MSSGEAELILENGLLWDGHRIDADSIAVGGGRIIATGRRGELDPLVGENTTLVDCGNRRVLPALIDSHMHVVRAGAIWARDISWEGVSTVTAALDAIHARASRLENGIWCAVLGGWHPNQFSEGRAPTLDELDEAAPDNPFFAQRNYIEAHLNSRAMAEMGWNDPSPPAGVEVNGHGAATGRVTGPALLAELRSRLPLPSQEEQIEATRSFFRTLNSLGLAGAVDAAGFGMSPPAYGPLHGLYQRGERGFRTRLLLGPANPGREEGELRSWIDSVQPGQGDEMVKYLGAGEVLLYSAHDMEGLDGRDVSGTRRALERITRTLVDSGWPVHIHAILDGSISTVLDSWEAIGTGRLTDLRYTITHAEAISEQSIRRVADAGLGITVQNGMSFRGADSMSSWGRSAAESAPPLRSLLDAGIPLGAGTDATVVSSYNPWACIRWMVTGMNVDGSRSRVVEQRLDLDEALRLYTSGSAWFSFEEEDRGNLNPGSVADVAVLSDDPFQLDPEELSRVSADLTVVGGEIVHQAI